MNAIELLEQVVSELPYGSIGRRPTRLGCREMAEDLARTPSGLRLMKLLRIGLEWETDAPPLVPPPAPLNRVGGRGK